MWRPLHYLPGDLNKIKGVSYRGMHIPFFDEKKLAVWKYQMESIFFTIECLGIARGDAKKKLAKQLGLSREEIAKRKRSNKSFVENRNLGLTCWYWYSRCL
jgi:hypothetical protein